MSSEALVSVSNLVYTYENDTHPTIKNINLEIESGTFTVITGPSGAGKTTLCRALVGLIPNFYMGKMEGNVTVCGLNTRKHSVAKLAQNIGLVFQNPDTQMIASSVEKEIRLGPTNIGLTEETITRRTEDMIQFFELDSIRKKAPYRLSGGQKQMVAIAAIVAMRPRVIILDEPAANLSPMTTVHLFLKLKELSEKLGLTIVTVEHKLLEFLLPLIDRFMIMNEGVTVLDIHPNDLADYIDHLLKFGVCLPQVTKVAHFLTEKSIKLERLPITVDQAYSMFRGLLK